MRLKIPFPLVRSIVGNIVIAAFFSIFVYINLKAYGTSGDISYLLVAFNESLYVLLYAVRRRPVATSTSISDWGIGFSGTFIGTLLRPATPFSAAIGGVLIIIGTIANIAAVASLNRSIATVPAERQIKTRGMFRFIRHPLYASEICVLFGYLIANCSLANVAVVLCDTILLLMRIDREERFLSRNSTYVAYAARTPWKLIPFIF
jgi:protein-S-isoprenylcysteine O-methyltransferase Ste14